MYMYVHIQVYVHTTHTHIRAPHISQLKFVLTVSGGQFCRSPQSCCYTTVVAAAYVIGIALVRGLLLLYLQTGPRSATII